MYHVFSKDNTETEQKRVAVTQQSQERRVLVAGDSAMKPFVYWSSCQLDDFEIQAKP